MTTLSSATGTFEVFVANNWKTFGPVSRPKTVPVIDPGVPSGCNAEVTLRPFSMTAERTIVAVEAPVMLILTESPVSTNSASGVLRLWIE